MEDALRGEKQEKKREREKKKRKSTMRPSSYRVRFGRETTKKKTNIEEKKLFNIVYTLKTKNDIKKF